MLAAVKNRMKTNNETIRSIQVINIILYILFLAVSLFFPKKVIIGVAIGGALSVLNFFFIQSLIGSALANNTKIGLKLFLYFIKLTGLLGLIYISIVYVEQNSIAFVIGLSIVFISVIIQSTINTLVSNKDNGTRI